LGVKKEKIGLEDRNGIWSPKSVWSCDMSIDLEFYMKQEKYYFGVKKVKISLANPETELGAQNKFGRVIYPSFENFI
jgi:hypothetical protein